ncbi:MAG TPA: ABC transporter permease subunit, partial [Acetobacteraceae bacterium]|nr:ABC transporter permease subunit [Acetobacteraceae bacterium]
MRRNDPARPGQPPLGLAGAGLSPNLYDLAIFILVAAAFAILAHGAREIAAPAERLIGQPISLDPWNLPEYALRTTLRMFAAIVASLLFTFVVATLAAKSRKAELVILPALDILQSVPVLGFLTFTVTYFLRLFPGSELGAECAAIFAIFTSQAWNMAFSFYQSLRTVPRDLVEVSRHFRLSPWLAFWRLEAPFAAPGLIWNTMMSMSGGWFFVVASEAITVGDTTVKLPGIGSWLAVAIDEKDIRAVVLAVAAMAVVILLYDQLVFRPIVAWADKFRFEQTAARERPRSWVYDLWRRARLMRRTAQAMAWLGGLVERLVPRPTAVPVPLRSSTARLFDRVWIALVLALVAFALWRIVIFTRQSLDWHDVLVAVEMGLLTFARVVVLIALASLVWVPAGVWIGLRPWAAAMVQPVAQFLAAFPANVLFPIAVVAIVHWHLHPDIWLSPLMVLGTQWYILFNV